ncbi:uncharacterized protein V6R79_010622 [Siganus canaliculatus]
MAPADRLKLLLFLALFFGAVGFLVMLLSCGTEYWLLASQSCSRPGGRHRGGGAKAVDNKKIFHEGLFWRCSFTAPSNQYSIWDFWISHQPPPELCQAAFLFPFPANEPISSWMESHDLPAEPYESPSAIVFRTFWSIFLVAGLTAVVVGGFVVICAGPMASHKLYHIGGALQLFGGLSLLAVLVMYLIWIQVLDTLEQFAHHQQVSTCPSFHLSIQHGPSFLLAPVAVFFCSLAGLLFILVARNTPEIEPDKRDKMAELPSSDV